MSEHSSQTQSGDVASDLCGEADGSTGENTAEASPVCPNTLSNHNLPVTLRFEAGTFTLPMAELASIPAGYVFELQKPLDRQAIEIFANDRAVASGELVLIGDAVGVRVTAIYPRATDLRA